MYTPDALRDETLRQPLSQRAVAPMVLAVGAFLNRFVPGTGWLRNAQKKIVLAGLSNKIDANTWAVVKILAGLGAFFAYLFVIRATDLSGLMAVLVTVGFVVLGVFAPDSWLRQRISDRKKEMQRDLPDVLDLLVISVEAGLGFDSALARVVDTVPGALSEEFFRMLQETRVGVSRRDAMRHLMERTDLEELRSFLLAMMQAEAFGVSISQVLRVQADEMRIKRRQHAQERAFGAPVKMVFPLIFCIFPSLFIVLLGPAAIKIFDLLLNL